MSTALGKKANTSLKVSAETTQLRRKLARADSLFSEGLARLQSDYKARVRAAALGEEEPQEETPADTTPTPSGPVEITN